MEMTNYNKLINNLEELKLLSIKDNLSSYTDMVANKEKSFIDALYELTEKEKSMRNERLMNNSVKTAGFPFLKRINDYDFTFQPSIDREKIYDLSTMRFIENKENILFVGSPGTGKTHLATSIGIEAALKRYSVHFISCQNLISDLMCAAEENRLEKRLKLYTRYKVLIIDEIGYLNLDEKAANLFFQLISRRYEKRSTIITTNKALAKWAEIFNDPVITNAILDRLLHHSHIINIVGPSYRVKDILSQLEDED